MTLNTVTIVNYKNIAEARLEFSPKLNCLITCSTRSTI